MTSENDSTSTETIICLRSFKSLRNTKGNIDRYFKAAGFDVREVIFEKDHRRRGGAYTAVVSLSGKECSSILKKKFLRIGKRKMRLEGLNVNNMHLELTPMITNVPPRPKHAASCPLNRLTWDSWLEIFCYVSHDDLQHLRLACSCGYNLLRQFEQQTRRSLSFRAEDYVRSNCSWNLPCNYLHLQRYLMRFNLSCLQRLQLNLHPFETLPLPWNFFAFLACHCPLLVELRLEKVTWMAFRQELSCKAAALERLAVLELLCASARASGSNNAFPAESLGVVMRRASKLRRLQLCECAFRRNFFDLLPDGLEELEVSGWFFGMPSDVLVSRFAGSLLHLSMSVSLKHSHARAPPCVSLLQLSALHSLKLHRCPLDLPSERLPLSSLQRLELHKPRDFSQETVEALGACCPLLRFLLLYRRYSACLNELDLRPLTALEELRMPQRMMFELLTDRLPASLRVLQIRMREHAVVGCGDSDRWRGPVHEYFSFILTLPRLEYLECGPVFYPCRVFFSAILERRHRGFPFLTIAQRTLLVPGEDVEQVGKSFRFLQMITGPTSKSILRGLRLERDFA